MKKIVIRPDSRADFRNLTDSCVGTGRVDLALHREYQEQLAAVQAQCHFKMIRGHGIFSDQMGIYQQQVTPTGEKQVWYCFTYLDRVMDAWLENGLTPFLETGFMPAALASSDHTLFYWQAHTVPPTDMQAWTDLVQATLRHLAERYGAERVAQWPCEIWNEPNLDGFWENADKQKYLQLYAATATAIKTVLPAMRVGGPAICGGTGSLDWITDFLAYCRDNRLPLDFVTRHAYMGQNPEHRGRYLYHPMCRPEDLIAEMQASRARIDAFPEYRGLPLYITEFNTSYNPFCPIHDTRYNAALCAALLSRLGDVAEGYSYWTFGDVFEEQGIPTRPFHGGFGLMANGCIPKPTLWSFAFFSQLRGEPVYRDEHTVAVRRPEGGYELVLWNLEGDTQLEIALPCAGVALLERVGDPLTAWHRMGEPESLNKEQLAFLQAAGQPIPEALDAPKGKITLTLKRYDVARLRVLPVTKREEPGYDYDYYNS